VDVFALVRPGIPCSNQVEMKQGRLGSLTVEETLSSPCKPDGTSWASQPDSSAHATLSEMEGAKNYTEASKERMKKIKKKKKMEKEVKRKDQKKGGGQIDITGEEASPYMREHKKLVPFDSCQAHGDCLHQEATVISPDKDNTCDPDTSYKLSGEAVGHYERQREITESLKIIREFHEATVQNIMGDWVATVERIQMEYAAMLAELWQMCEENTRKLMERCAAKATSGMHDQTE
jgi:hypothetical protein